MSLQRWTTKIAAVVGAAMMSGCYNYVPVERPTPGSTVRIEVPVRSAVTGSREPSEVAAMDGTLVSAGDSLVLEISSLKTIGNFREIRSLDTLRLARSDISTIRLREFSKPKTVGLAVIVAGGVTALTIAALGLSGGSSGNNGPPGGSTTGALVVNPIFSGLLNLIGR